MGTLNGHARAVVGQLGGNSPDHTSVTCTGVPGHLWRCWGDPPPGPIISNGKGSTKQANLISTPTLVAGFHDLAGILYGITGVCHQASNRILFPAQIDISNAKGYRVSSLVFGKFGEQLGNVRARLALRRKFGALFALNRAVKFFSAVDWIVKLNKHVNVQGDLPECMPGEPDTALPPPSDSQLSYQNEMSDLYTNALEFGDGDTQLWELLRTLTMGIDTSERNERSLALMEAHTLFIERQSDTLGDFLENAIDTAAWIELSNANIKSLQFNILELIGVDAFERNVQIEAGQALDLIQPEIALEVYGAEFNVEN